MKKKICKSGGEVKGLGGGRACGEDDVKGEQRGCEG